MSTASSLAQPAGTRPPPPGFAVSVPNAEILKQRLISRGVVPTPKVLHALRKKVAQKAARRSKKQALKAAEAAAPPVSEAQRQLAKEEAHFRTVTREYRAVKGLLEGRDGKGAATAVGIPWERTEGVDLRGIGGESDGYDGGKLKGEHLEELREVLAERNGEKLRWLLDDDVEAEEGDRSLEAVWKKKNYWNQESGDREKVSWLVQRLSTSSVTIQDWKFPKLMKQSGLLFTENGLLKVLDELGALGNWKQALDVVEWVYGQKDYRHSKSRFVYTKLLAVVGKARRPNEALRIFNMMREDCQIYPDMAAYHSIAVTLGQAGLVKELINIVELMRQKPSKKLKNMRRRDWDPCLEPDIIVYNAVLNACVPTRQWKGVSWVLQQMRRSGLQPTGATYGLAMEVMLEAGKYDLVHKLFGTMQRGGLALKALTYKVLLKAFWKEGKIDEAVAAVRDMEQRGIVGAASVYYELARCLCHNGRWKEAMLEVDNMKKLPLSKPVQVAFTGMILSSLDGGHLHDCIAIFKSMKDYCTPDIGTINAMLKVYCHADMFAKAKELFETTKSVNSSLKICHDVGTSLTPDAFSYNLMLEASASAHQWEYFEHLYKEMTINGCKLDQNKYTWLLVEASKAGKWHLLEHAFDTILEAGDVPDTLLFTEMLCQAVAQQNYERAVPLANMMAHASLQISEKQWTCLFERNRDRLDENKLQVLLDLLENSDVVREDPVFSLIKSLQCICSSNRQLERYVSSSHLTVDGSTLYNDRSVAHTDGKTLNNAGLTFSSDTISNNLQLLGSGKIVQPSPHNSDPVVENGRELTGNNPEESVSPMASSFSVDCIDAEGSDNTIQRNCSDSEITVSEEIIDSLIEGIGFSRCSDLPSASDILETWKQSRIKDGFFQFQI